MHLSGTTLGDSLIWVLDWLLEQRVALGSVFLVFSVPVLFYNSHLVISRYLPYLPKKKESVSVPVEGLGVVPTIPPITFRRNSKNLGIFDSLSAFSHIGPNHLELIDYDRLARIFSCADIDSEIVNNHLIGVIRKTRDVTRSLNDHLEELAVQGFNAMLMFVFQVNMQEQANMHSSTEAVVNWEDEKSTHTCPQMNLTILLRLIHSTALLTADALDENKKLLGSFEQTIKTIKEKKSESSPKKRTLTALQDAIAHVHLVQSGLEHWRRQLKIYSTNVRFTQLVDKCGGAKRSYLQDTIKRTMDRLLEFKAPEGA